MLSHSAPGQQLPMIFYKIRAARTQSTRRSWQRRARLILDAIPHLTDQERHEIMVSWSHPACHRVNSPAMHKLTGRPPMPNADIDPRTLYRAAFDADGKQLSRQSQDAKKPELVRLIDHGPAANDATFSIACDPCIPNHSVTVCTAPADLSRPLFLATNARLAISHHEFAWGDSDNRSCPSCGTPCYPHHPALPSPYLQQWPAPPSTPIFSFLPLKFNSNALRRATIDVQTFDYQRPYLLTPLDRFRLTQHHNPMAPTTPDDWP